MSIPIFNGTDYSGTPFHLKNNEGKVTVLNFWYTECGGCVAELPDFERIAADYAHIVTVVALTKSNYADDSHEWINQNYPDSKILWGKDSPIDPADPTSPDILFKSLGGGDAYPITVVIAPDGKIFAMQNAGLSYEALYMLVMGAKASTES